MYIPTFTFGKVPVQVWEYPAIALIILLLSIFGAQFVRRNVRHDPSWKYFLPGLWLKLGGGLFFALVYVLYYKGGDTTSYYECAMAYVNLMFDDFGKFMIALQGGGTVEIKSLFTSRTGSPMGYMFFDDKTRMVIKLCIPFVLFAGKSYFIATLFIALATYGGLWSLYRMFLRHYPAFHRNLAIAVLFMPSVIFWGSGMLKDSFTLAATCYFIVATDKFINRNRKFWPVVAMLISGAIIVSIKPYILLILFPGTLVWYFYKRIRNIKNAYFRFVMVPGIYAVIILGSYGALVGLGDRLGKFSIDKAFKTAAVIQHDLKQEYYDGASFDIGTIEPTAWGVVKKFPAAVVAGLFRPFLWEARNPMMLLSGLENTLILVLTIYVFIGIRPKITFGYIKDDPLLLYSLVFAVLFAFMIGVTTANFGALVRFKIPLIPLYMGSLAIIYSKVRLHINAPKRKRPRSKQGPSLIQQEL